MTGLRSITAVTAVVVASVLASACASSGARGAATGAATTTTPANVPSLGCVAVGDEVRHRGPASPKAIALTFDDGPSAYTPQVLTVLAANHVPGTFFVIGRNIAGRETLLRQEVAAGDAIGDHTFHHVRLDKLPVGQITSELGSTQTLIEKATGGYTTCLFRPPNGTFNGNVERVGRQLGMLAILWSAQSHDYQRPGTEAIYRRTIAGATPGGIVLLHDGGGNRAETVAALPRIIATLRARGYTFKTVPQLLALPNRPDTSG